MSDYISIVHCKENPCDVLICRGTAWGNPFSYKQGTKAKWIVKTRKESIEKFKEWMLSSQDEEAVYIREHMHELKGKRLGCYCKNKKHPDRACHGDVYAELLDPSPFDDFMC